MIYDDKYFSKKYLPRFVENFVEGLRNRCRCQSLEIEMYSNALSHEILNVDSLIHEKWHSYYRNTVPNRLLNAQAAPVRPQDFNMFVSCGRGIPVTVVS